MKRVRRPPLQHPLADVFGRAVGSITTALHPDTARHYRGTARRFLTYLATHHPDVCSVHALRRDPHILGWLASLRSQTPPLVTASCINVLISLRCILHELAWTEQLPDLVHLIRSEDIPRMPQRLPRPLTIEQDRVLQQELSNRDDLGGNAFLLIRHTGIRIGECADLSCDCLRSVGPDQWAIHVPLGKLKTERMVPVDSFICELIQRLRFFRSLDVVPSDGYLLPRPHSKEALVRQLRDYLHQVCAAANLPTRIVPHQLRHTYATEMLRSGVSFSGLMKLLGHTSPEMTMRYVEIVQSDLQHEFHLARSQPRHLAPRPRSAAPIAPATGLDGVIDAFRTAQHVFEMYRRTISDDNSRRLDRLSNRLTKIVAEIRAFQTPEKRAEIGH
jgi:site-specific recombinase XerD